MRGDESVHLIGEEKLRLKLEHPEWMHKPARRFLEKWGSFVERTAMGNIIRGKHGWIDTGFSKQSLTHEVDSSEFPLWARAGSNQKKVRWGEYGTGLLSEDPESSKKRHWPPGAALDKWALKHKIPSKSDPAVMLTGRDIARIIGLRGGLEPRRFLRKAAETAEPKIAGWLTDFGKEIEVEASARVS